MYKGSRTHAHSHTHARTHTHERARAGVRETERVVCVCVKQHLRSERRHFAWKRHFPYSHNYTSLWSVLQLIHRRISQRDVSALASSTDRGTRGKKQNKRRPYAVRGLVPGQCPYTPNSKQRKHFTSFQPANTTTCNSRNTLHYPLSTLVPRPNPHRLGVSRIYWFGLAQTVLTSPGAIRSDSV